MRERYRVLWRLNSTQLREYDEEHDALREKVRALEGRLHELDVSARA